MDMASRTGCTISTPREATNLVIDHRSKPAAADWALSAPAARMSPEELCYHLRDLIMEHEGSVRRECVPSAIVLTCLLRKQGLDARTCTGVYHRPNDPAYGPIDPDEHAYVRCAGQIYDPTREQYEDLPLVCGEDDPHYEDLHWRSYSPPEYPPSDLLPAAYGSPHHSWGGKNGWFAICSELTSGGPWAERRV